MDYETGKELEKLWEHINRLNEKVFPKQKKTEDDGGEEYGQ